MRWDSQEILLLQPESAHVGLGGKQTLACFFGSCHVLAGGDEAEGAAVATAGKQALLVAGQSCYAACRHASGCVARVIKHNQKPEIEETIAMLLPADM